MTMIYALVWGQLVLYVGQTIQTLRKREREHRSKGNRASSKYIPDDIDWEIKLLEECEDDIATMREQYYYDTLKPFYNNNRPGQTKKEYRQTEAYKEIQRKYRQTEAGKESQRKCEQTEARKKYQRERHRRYYAAKKAAENSA